jgi:hypothetical protein
MRVVLDPTRSFPFFLFFEKTVICTGGNTPRQEEIVQKGSHQRLRRHCDPKEHNGTQHGLRDQKSGLTPHFESESVSEVVINNGRDY